VSIPRINRKHGGDTERRSRAVPFTDGRGAQEGLSAFFRGRPAPLEGGHGTTGRGRGRARRLPHGPSRAHDASVVGDETCEVIDFGAMATYAKRQGEASSSFENQGRTRRGAKSAGPSFPSRAIPAAWSAEEEKNGGRGEITSEGRSRGRSLLPQGACERLRTDPSPVRSSR
jgi:hypothetical protein